MTEKRYIVKQCEKEFCIFDSEDDNNCICVCDVRRIAELICNRLNKQDMMIKSQEKQLQKQHTVIAEQDKRINELEEENASMKGRILNAMVKSNQVECNCTTCVCEDYVHEELKKW